MQEIHKRVGGACTWGQGKRSPSDALFQFHLPDLSSHFSFFLQGIVRTLRQSDAQLFAGWGSYPSISDTVMLEKIDCLADKAATLLKVAAYFIDTVDTILLVIY